MTEIIVLGIVILALLIEANMFAFFVMGLRNDESRRGKEEV